MKLYGLSGKSGTGKSYKSNEVCAAYGIEALLDDGLLICGREIAAGRSAKREDTKIGAVKCAILQDEDHCREIREALASREISSLLIIGTSDKMIRLIAQRLGISEEPEIIHIEDLTTKKDRQLARKMRESKGMHVIPAPTFQVRKQFSGYFIDAKRGFRSTEYQQSDEKTIIRPTYSYLGNFEISGTAINDIVSRAAKEVEGIASVLWIASDNTEPGMFLRIIILSERNADIISSSTELQKRVTEIIEYMTDFNVLGVDVEVHGFFMS